MNKLFIVFLAVSLVAVHGDVKRDAPAAPANNENYLDKVKTTFEDFTKDVNEKLKETFNPDEIKKNFDQFVNGVNKFIEDSKTKKE